MLNSEQQKWIDHLSDESKIEVVPFDPTSQAKFEKVRSIIINKFGQTIQLEHRGASSLCISGQNEIDTYIPVDIRFFDIYITKLTKVFGKPRKIYIGDRAHFIAWEDSKRVDIYLINKKSPSYLNGVKFENHLKSHSDDLEKYRILKEEGNGLSVREYYRRKIEFINVGI